MANGNFAGGDGSVYNPYKIEDAHDLNAIRNNLTASYQLINDIDLDVSPYNEGLGWNSISVFEGTLFGNGKIIKNLFIDANQTGYRGLFGRVKNALIKNLKIENVKIVNIYRNTGSLVGYSNGVIIKNCCVVNGDIEKPSYEELGGLVGSLWSGTNIIKNCYTLNIKFNHTSSSKNGGFVGYSRSEDFSFVNCYSANMLNETNGFIGSGLMYWPTAEGSFFDTTKAGTERAGNIRGVIGLTTKEMKNPQEFINAGWDQELTEEGEPVWILKEGKYPRLWFETPPINNKFLFQDSSGFTKTFDLSSKKWNIINPNSRDTKSKGISSLDNLIQNTKKTIKPQVKADLETGKKFSEPVNLKAFKTISNISII